AYGAVDRGRIRRALADRDLAGVLVEQDQIGEGPANVYADARSHCSSASERLRVGSPRARFGQVPGADIRSHLIGRPLPGRTIRRAPTGPHLDPSALRHACTSDLGVFLDGAIRTVHSD